MNKIIQLSIAFIILSNIHIINSEEINCDLVNSEDSIRLCNIYNQTSNSNGTPRIMGGKVLTEWIKKHYKQGDLMKIDILSNDSIKLNKKI